MYKECVKIDSMGIVTFEEEPLIFHIKCFLPENRKHIIEIEALLPNAKRNWTKAIEERLWKQLQKFKGILSKIN